MARRKFIKVTRATLICSAVAAALGVMGVGYASWNQRVSISSKISTGSIDMIFNEAYFNNDPNGGHKFNEVYFNNDLSEDENFNDNLSEDENFNDNSNGDIVYTENIKFNDVSLEVDSNTILISGIMYYPNDIVLKYDVANEGTIPVQMINEGQEKYEFENGGFISINHDSETIIIHIPRVDGEYYATVPIEFESKYGSWNETLFIDLNIYVELPMINSMTGNNQVTTSSAISMDTSEDEIYESIEEDSLHLEEEADEESENNDSALEEENKSQVENPSEDNESKADDQTKENDSELEERNETLDDLFDAIIVESKDNNEVEADSSQLEEETDKESEDTDSVLEQENESEADNSSEENEIDSEEESEADAQSQGNHSELEEENETEIVEKNDSNTESGEEPEVNAQQLEEVTQTEIAKILEALDKLSDSIIVESKTNNEVDNQ